MVSKSSGGNPDNYDGSSGDKTPTPASCRALGTGSDLRELPINRPEGYEELAPEQKILVRKWIGDNLDDAPINRPATGPRGSYSLKHVLKEDTGLYVTNGQMIGAMLQAGYTRISLDEVNPIFRVELIRWRAE